MPEDFRSRVILKGKSDTQAAFDKSATAAGRVAGKLGAIAKAGALAGAALVAAFGASAIRKQTEFAAKVSELAAITGASGDDLKFLSDASKELGRTTTLSASQAAEAFKLVASAKPDLLDNAEALKAVTQESVLLAEAAGIELPQAATTVGSALNQFGADAAEAGRFVNVLAAGAKFGSSEIADTALALKNAGVAASSAGISFEQTNAAIQTLAAVGVKGAEAGTALRSIFIKLQTQANDQFNPAVVGLGEALDNLGEANLSATELTKLFGQEQFAVASALIENRDNFDGLTEAVTGTNTAVEQANVRNDNLAGDLKKLQSAFEGLQILIGERFEPLLRTIVQSITAVTNQIIDQQGEVDALDDKFGAFDKTLRTVVATFQVIDTILEIVGQAIGANLAILTKIIEGEFSEALAIAETAFDDLGNIAAEGFGKAAETITTETAAAVATVAENPEVMAAANAVGEVIAAEVTKGAATAGEVAAEEAAAKELERFQAKVDRLREQNLAEQTILQEKLDADLMLAQEARDKDLLSLNEFLQIKFNLEAEAQEKLKKLEMKNQSDQQKFTELTAKGKTKFVLGQLQALTQGVAQENKVLFRINQAAAIGNAIINTAEGITKALSAAPPPVNIALAAITAAAGAAQIAAIASTKPGSGTTPSVAGTTPTLGGQPVQGITPPTLDTGAGEGATGPGQEININISGIPESGVLPAESVRDLMRSINEELGDGANLNVAGGRGGGT